MISQFLGYTQKQLVVEIGILKNPLEDGVS